MDGGDRVGKFVITLVVLISVLLCSLAAIAFGPGALVYAVLLLPGLVFGGFPDLVVLGSTLDAALWVLVALFLFCFFAALIPGTSRKKRIYALLGMVTIPVMAAWLTVAAFLYHI